MQQRQLFAEFGEPLVAKRQQLEFFSGFRVAGARGELAERPRHLAVDLRSLIDCIHTNSIVGSQRFLARQCGLTPAVGRLPQMALV